MESTRDPSSPTPFPLGQLPAPTLAAVEEHRYQGLGRRIAAIKADPSNPSRGSLPYYEAARDNARATWRRATDPTSQG